MAIVDSDGFEDLYALDPWTWPRGPQLGWFNRQIMAVRMNWPAGALEACEAIQRSNPAWSPWWRAANVIPGFRAPAGFYARPGEGERSAYGADADALAAVIKARSSRCQACGTLVPVAAGCETPSHLADADGRWCYARRHQLTVDTSWSRCPRCRTWWDVPKGSEVPPHQDGTGWCAVRCSQTTV